MPNTGNAEFDPGRHRRGPGETREVGRARGEQPGLGAVRAAHAEIDQQLPRRGEHAARGFRRDQRRKMQQAQQPALHHLRLRDRRGDAQHRLVDEKRRALRQRMHVAGEAQRAQRGEKRLAKAAVRAQPVELGLGHAELLEVAQAPAPARRPAGNCAPGGSARTKNSNTAVSAMPSSK